MGYITISNSKKIVRNINELQLDLIEEKIYKWDIYFFNRRETKTLKGIRELLRDPANFLLKYYTPIQIIDTLSYVYPESQPSYHKDHTCSRLNSNFVNIEIPFEIKQKGEDEVIKFREWFKQTQFEEGNPKDYIFKLQIKFPYVGEINPKSIEYSNTGFEERKDYSLQELEKEIDDILRAAGDYFKSNPKLQNIIRRFQKWTFLAYVHGEIQNNDTELNDAELKLFLKNYDESYKKPVKILLEEYYRVKFNPEMKFEGSLLEQLGFRRCSTCLFNNDFVLFNPAENI